MLGSPRNKSLRLEKELSLFKAKEEKLGKQLGKGTLGRKKNQAPLAGHEKSRENLVKLSEKERRQTPQRVGIQGHAVADAPTGVARAILFIVRGYSQGISLLPSSLPSLINLTYKSSYHTFHHYEPGSQGIFINEAFHCIVYSCNRLPRTTTSLPPGKV